MVYIPTKKKGTQEKIEEQVNLEAIDDIDNITINDRVKVLDLFCRLPGTVGYATEMSWELTMSEYHLKNILSLLLKEELIETVHVHPNGEPRLLQRVTDQAMIGQSGYANFCRKRWFGITDKGRHYLEVRKI